MPGSIIRQPENSKSLALARVPQILLKRIVNHSIQLLLMHFGIQRSPLMQLMPKPHIEAAFERSVRRFSLFFAEPEIFVHCLFEISLRLFTPGRWPTQAPFA